MTTKEQILQAFKRLLGNFEDAPAEGGVDLAEEVKDAPVVELLPEAEVKISQREVGGKVERVGPEGELSTIEDGNYEMEDGFKFTVKDGVIASIEGQDAPAEEAAVEAAEEVAGVECQLPDGKVMVCTPKVEVGATCTIDGEPAPDGEYQCTQPDGMKCICVCKDGVCVEIKPVEDEQMAEDAPSELDAVKAEVEALKQTLAELQTALDELKGASATKEDVSEFSNQVVELNKNIIALAKVPAQFSQTSQDVKVKENKTVQLSALANVIGAARK